MINRCWSIAGESGEYWVVTEEDYQPIQCTLENATLQAASPELLDNLRLLVNLFSNKAITPNEMDTIKTSKDLIKFLDDCLL